MNKYIKPYLELVTENFQQFGVVLIKGKPNGKDRQIKLFAAHVMSTVEIRPGATMLILSNIFYRIIQEDGRLRAIKISYGDDDNLKTALNFKTSGRPSVVKNNNKTPFHWRTLKYTDIGQALSAVGRDLLGPEYIFENAAPTSPADLLLETFLGQLFIEGTKDFVIIDSNIPTDAIQDAIGGEEEGFTEAEYEIWLRVLNLEEASAIKTFDVTITCKSNVGFSGTTRWGGYQQADEIEQKIDSITTEILDVVLESGDEWAELSEDSPVRLAIGKLVIEWEPDDFNNHVQMKSQYLKF
jgi:hypothetical protein